MYKPKGYKVERLNQKNIMQKAASLRGAAQHFITLDTGYFDLGEFVCYLLDNNDILFEMQIVEDELTQEEGIAIPSKNGIAMPDHVFNSLMDNQPRARFTVAHELGHLMLHEQKVYYLNGIDSWHHHEEDSEWQANMFAAHLLIDFEKAKNLKTADQIATQFGVSMEVAMIYMKNIKRM
ncbi:ImmA/IrrE family metallo-endopeptidase [Aliikangiella sp. IMCC44359]|uniref:ImmA/IrrE family metallo-endopeptidase n=1 Tax=Aliikangiella sp. IMCC44359 TaxID=3459125 RepID=UPI00403ABF9F